MALTTQAHEILRNHIEMQTDARKLAVDATCGNGHDTEFLCSLGFSKVFGFDIQKRAVESAKQRLKTAGYDNFLLLQQSHAKLDSFIFEEINCAMFNFGYLPHGDKAITTSATSSVLALSQCAELLTETGIITAMCYPGHDQGYEETQAILAYLESRPSEFKLRKVRSVKPTDHTPLLLIITRSETSQ